MNQKKPSLTKRLEDRLIAIIKKAEDPQATEKEKEAAKKAWLKLSDWIQPIINRIAQQYATSGHNIEKLLIVGNNGLMKAIHNYKPEKGYKFLTFSAWHIRSEITKYLSDHR